MATVATPAISRPSALRGYFETSLYLLLLVSVLALVSTGKLDLVSMLLAPAALLLKGYRWWRGRGPELSHRTATWLVVGYFAFFPLDLWWVSRSLSADAQNPLLFSALLAAIHLMLFAMIVRLFSARTTRDSLFLSLLAFSTMLASAILTVDTAFIGFFLVFLVLGASTFIGLELRRAAEGTVWSPLEAGTPMARRLHTALGVSSAAVALSAIIAGGAIFLLIPRFRAGYLSGFNLQAGLISGFSDEAELGRIGEIQRSNAVVMRIRVEGNPAAAQNIHWRGIALTMFDGRRWFTEERQSAAITQGADDWIRLRLPAGPPRSSYKPLGYSVLLEPLASDAIFVAAEPLQVRGQFNTNAAMGGRVRRAYLMQDKTGSLSNPFHNFANVRYDVVSLLLRVPDQTLRDASRSYPASIRDLYLQVPELDPRIPALAREITAGAHTPLDQARAIERYLPAHYAYTLDLVGPAPTDPLAHFLFERRAGHCEYFASAMAILLRSLGVPTRYVNGFLGGEYNDIAEDYIVRARHAHSWVEAFFPGYGWVTFDPTPPAEERPVSLLTRLTYYWDWFELQWSEWVINYDFFRQYALAQNVRTASHDWTVQLKGEFERVRNIGVEWLRHWQTRIRAVPPWLPLLIAAPLALGLCLLSTALREKVLLAWRLRAGRGPLPPHAAALSYRRMLLLLERRGWKKSPFETPMEFAAALPNPTVAAPVARLTALYQAARFGGHPSDAGRFAALLAELQAALRARSGTGADSLRVRTTGPQDTGP
jgi:transglutaminase-like putative cysteine protease